MDRKRFLLPMLLGLFFLMLAFASPVSADDPPPPEQPVAPPAAPAGQPAAAQPDLGGADEPLQPAEQLALLDLYDPLGGDPYFKLGSKTYRFLPAGGDCGAYPATDYCEVSAADTPIQDAIDYVAANSLLPSDRTIYVEKGIYNESTAGIVIDGLGNAYLAQLKGLKGVGSSNTILALADTSRLNTWVKVTGSTAGFTLSGFNITGSNAPGVLSLVDMNSITGAVVLSDLLLAKGTSPEPLVGLNISANGAITLDKVTADAMPNEAARLTSTAASGSYGVKITHSSFNRSLSAWTTGVTGALWIDSIKAVQIYTVSASGNNGTGLVIASDNGFTIEDGAFSGNISTALPDIVGMGYGIFSLGSSGPVTMKSVIASGNEETGIFIDDHNGDISIQDSLFNDNDGSGVILDTCNEAGGVCTLTAAGKITIKNTSARLNGVDGISLLNAKGAVLMDGVNAVDNSNIGAQVNTVYNASATVTVYRSRFDDNYTGLEITTKGAVKLDNVTANMNEEEGAHIDNSDGAGTITLSSAYGGNVFYDNGDIGLYLESDRNISLDLVTASANGEQGIQVVADGGTGTVNVTRAVAYNNENHGLDIASANTITLNNVTAIANALGCGAILDNAASSSAGINIQSSKGANQFIGNTLHGVQVETNGGITITDITASGNNASGAYLESDGASSTVSITRGEFTGNSSRGVAVYADGKVTLNTILAAGNHNFGVYIDNDPGLGVTMTLVDASNNIDINGNMAVYSTGPITLTNCDARGTQNGMGVVLDNRKIGSTASITVTNSRSGVYSDFSGNDDRNLYILTYGSVTIKGIDASGSLNADGLYILQDNGNNGAISITNSIFNDNKTSGLSVSGYGAVTLSSVVASGNDLHGVLVDNDAGAGAVSLTSVTAEYNLGNGIKIDSLGAVKVSKSQASHNQGDYGLHIDNITGLGTGSAAITVEGTSSSALSRFDDNNEVGLYLVSDGNISVKYVSASRNRDLTFGALMNNTSGAGTLTITSSTFEGNAATNLRAISDKAITLTTGSASGSLNARGAYISNNTSIANDKLVITGWIFHNNASVGLEAYSNGPITISKSNAVGNGANGIYLANNAFEGMSVTVSGASSSSPAWVVDNASHGLYIITRGTVSLKYLEANQNGITNSANGIYIDGQEGAITIANTRINRNHYGLFADTRNKITLTTVTVNTNVNYGIDIDNLGSLLTTNNITLTVVTANENGARGMDIDSAAGIILTNCHASGNHVGGVSLDNHSVSALVTVSYSATSGYSQFFGNGGAGLQVESNGAVSLTRIQANDNNGYGLYVDMDTNIQPLTMNTVSLERNAGFNAGIFTAGSVTWTGGLASDGGASGVHIINNYGTGAVNLSKVTADGNMNYGLYINTKGVVTLKDTNASFNQTQSGIYVINSSTDAGFSISGSNRLVGNDEYGMLVSISGDIAVSGVTAAGNGDVGIYLETDGVDKAISVKNSTIMDNFSDGLYIYAVDTDNDVITLSGLKVLRNGFGNNGSGITVLNPNVALTLIDSILTGNYNFGIYASIGTAGLTLDGCEYLGNNASGTAANLGALSGIITILP